MPDLGVSGKRRSGRLATKVSVFTGILVLWVTGVILSYDLYKGHFDGAKALFVMGVVAAVASAIAAFTIRLLVRPLDYLHEGIRSVREGCLEPIPVSRTGDEIEYLAESFNEMIAALAKSRAEVRENQELLEERIRQRTEALEEAVQRTQAANRAKSEFLANVSHELRTPMSGVLGMLDLVLETPLNPEQREHLDTAKRCALSLLALLNDILDLSKIEAGRMVLEEVPFSPAAIVKDTCKSMEPRARQKNIGLRVKIADDIPQQIIGDPLRFRQIVSNLVSNAIKFTIVGQVDVDLSLRPAGAADGPRMVLTVTDTGIGIPEEKQALIFEKFTQADGTISRRFGGTGLGLAITRHLAEMQGGQIKVQSKVGAGSRFTVTLPIRVPQALSPEEDSGNSPAREAKLASSRPAGRILVVEDNLVNQRIITKLLEKRGYQVVVAANGEQGIQKLRQEDFDLVLMDVQMPVMNGLDATRAIRSDSKLGSVPVVAMTAHAMQGDRERCLEAGMNAYISKPVDPALLYRTIESILEQRRSIAGGPKEKEQRADAPPAIDLAEAKRLMGDDVQLITSMIQLFLMVAPDRMARLRIAGEKRDLTALAEESRRLRSAALRIGATEVANQASQVEMAAHFGRSEEIRESLGALEAELRRLNQHVESDLWLSAASSACSAS